ncbi:MAG: Polysialic acid transport protein KpsD precursor [bacterium ADurb.Bin429]|nr:MAG: Polysialic acid transport protein KpsD precursor [bacterium ADurb.Bin429]
MAPSQPEPAKPRLSVFGQDFFRAAGINFEPNPEAPVPPDYVLGSGDSLSVICWYGNTEYERATVLVNGAGEIYLKTLGVVPASSRTAAQMTDELRRRYAKLYKQFELSVRVVGRRTIPVWVMGEVTKPGKFMLSSMATVFTALYAAGGPSDLGSLRAIRLMRHGKQVGADIDVYQYLLNGIDVSVPLEPGDTLFVPFTRTLVALDGEVRRPAIYELRETDITLSAALALAGGATPNSADLVSIVRVNADRERQTIDCTLPKDAAFVLRNGDIVTVKAVPPPLKNAVAIRGAVHRPGQYSIEKAPSIPVLVELAGGFTADAYLEQAIIERQQDDGTLIKLPVSPRKILAKEPGAELPLRAGDTLTIFTRTQLPELLDIVTITGEVVKPGPYPFRPGMRVADLMELAFGPSTNAYLTQAYLYRYPVAADAVLMPVNLEKALAGDVTANLVLQARDRLMVKSRDEVLDFVVRVDGEVEKPGALAFYRGMRISDAVFLAGGLKVNVTLDRALLTRIKKDTYTEELIEVHLREALAKNPRYDLPLREGDHLVIYPISQTGEAQFVTIDGAVSAPGTYPYRGEMRVSHLLFLAKGVLLTAYVPRADLYRIRSDNTVEVIAVNLDDAQSGALTNANPLLRPRDRLVVVKREEVMELPTVQIDGPVRKPGAYRLVTGMKLSDLLHQAGGFMPEADTVVELHREVNGKLSASPFTVTIDGENVSLKLDPFLQAHDLITVMENPHYRDTRTAFLIKGAVSRPGSYPLYTETGTKPKTLYEALNQLELLPEAYPAGITLYRSQSLLLGGPQKSELARFMVELDQRAGVANTNAAASEEAAAEDAAKNQSVRNMSSALAQVISTNDGDSVTLIIPPRQMSQQVFGLSLAIDAAQLLRTKGRQGDIELAPGDVIVVPKTPETVTVIGGVINNGTVRYQPKKSINYYLDAVGGIAEDGEKRNIVVLRANGRMLPARAARAVEPGDVIIVPTKHIAQVIKTKGAYERIIQTLSEMALIALPFTK